MTAVREGLPDGRYGRSADRRADRKLKIVGAVLGVALLGVVGWSGYSYIAGQDLSGRVITWDRVSDHAVKVHLEVVKGKGDTGVCTLRSQADSGARWDARTSPWTPRRSRWTWRSRSVRRAGDQRRTGRLHVRGPRLTGIRRPAASAGRPRAHRPVCRPAHSAPTR